MEELKRVFKIVKTETKDQPRTPALQIATAVPSSHPVFLVHQTHRSQKETNVITSPSVLVALLTGGQ